VSKVPLSFPHAVLFDRDRLPGDPLLELGNVPVRPKEKKNGMWRKGTDADALRKELGRYRELGEELK
jgi:hypothetical protein